MNESVHIDELFLALDKTLWTFQAPLIVLSTSKHPTEKTLQRQTFLECFLLLHCAFEKMKNMMTTSINCLRLVVLGKMTNERVNGI